MNGQIILGMTRKIKKGGVTSVDSCDTRRAFGNIRPTVPSSLGHPRLIRSTVVAAVVGQGVVVAVVAFVGIAAASGQSF